MALNCYYSITCDLCGDMRYLGADKAKANIWQHQLPVMGNNDIHYELMDVCPTCLESIALRPVDGDGAIRYVRGEGSLC